MIAFEAGFHFTGTRNGIYIEALSRLGYSVKRKVKRPTLLPKSVEPANAATKQVARTHADRNPASAAVCDTDKIGEKQAQELDEMALFYQNAKAAKTGETVICPNCAEDFRKRTYNQCFCTKGCKDNFWNLVKPERLKAARGALVTA